MYTSVLRQNLKTHCYIASHSSNISNLFPSSGKVLRAFCCQNYRLSFCISCLERPQTPGLPKMPRNIWLAQVSYSVFDIANRLGPVFRYGPNRLSFNTSTALHTIYTPKANIRKSDFYKILNSPAGPSILAAIPNDMHARKKRVLSQAFSEKALRSIEEYMLLHTREFCEKLSSSPEPVNMSHWSTYLTGDVLGEVCFGQSFSMLKEKTNRRLIGLITRTARFGLIVSTISSTPLSL